MTHLVLRRICCDNDKQLSLGVGLDDDVPGLTAMPSQNHPPACNDVTPITSCMLEHTPKIDLCKLAVHHSLEEMRVKLELPASPFWPSVFRQGSLVDQFAS